MAATDKFDYFMRLGDVFNSLNTHAKAEISYSYKSLEIRFIHPNSNSTIHREDGPARLTVDMENGFVPRMEWIQNGKHHRTDGPAKIEAIYNGGQPYVYSEEWMINGTEHRVGGPSAIKRARDGIIIYDQEIRYKQLNKFSRPDGPASLKFGVTAGQVVPVSESWHLDGQLHRTDGPALIEYVSYVVIPRMVPHKPSYMCKPMVVWWPKLMKYYHHGTMHRLNGPAVVEYDSRSMSHTNRTLKREWFMNGARHRDISPAIIKRDFAINNKHYNDLYWYQHNSIDRPEGGPASIQYFQFGHGRYRRQESYYVNGRVHCDDGPARINYYSEEGTDNIARRRFQYYLNGQEITRQDHAAVLLNRNTQQQLSAQHNVAFGL